MVVGVLEIVVLLVVGMVVVFLRRFERVVEIVALVVVVVVIVVVVVVVVVLVVLVVVVLVLVVVVVIVIVVLEVMVSVVVGLWFLGYHFVTDQFGRGRFSVKVERVVVVTLTFDGTLIGATTNLLRRSNKKSFLFFDGFGSD